MVTLWALPLALLMATGTDAFYGVGVLPSSLKRAMPNKLHLPSATLGRSAPLLRAAAPRRTRRAPAGGLSMQWKEEQPLPYQAQWEAFQNYNTGRWKGRLAPLFPRLLQLGGFPNRASPCGYVPQVHPHFAGNRRLHRTLHPGFDTGCLAVGRGCPGTPKRTEDPECLSTPPPEPDGDHTALFGPSMCAGLASTPVCIQRAPAQTTGPEKRGSGQRLVAW